MESSVMSDVSSRDFQWTSAAQKNPNHSKDDGDVSPHIIHLKSLRSDGQICEGAPASVYKQRSCRVNWGKSYSWSYCIIREEKVCAEMSDWDLHELMNMCWKQSVLTHRQTPHILESFAGCYNGISVFLAVKDQDLLYLNLRMRFKISRFFDKLLSFFQRLCCLQFF